MPRKQDGFTPVVVTANTLRSGAVVFRAADGTWTRDIAGAEIAADPAHAETILTRALDDQRACHIVEPVLIEIRRVDGRVGAASLRERIRAEGPTITPPADTSPAIA